MTFIEATRSDRGFFHPSPFRLTPPLTEKNNNHTGLFSENTRELFDSVCAS